MPEYETILHRWFDEVWNQKRTDTIEEMLTEETRHFGISGPGGEPVTGIDNFKAFHGGFLAAFPDLNIEVHEVIREGEKFAGLYTVTGTHDGPLPDREATGREVKFHGSGMCMMKDGKFDEVWNVIDFMKMNHDLSLPPEKSNEVFA